MAAPGPSASCIHPYRKRKFFFDLAALFGESPPLVQSVAEVFPPSPGSADDGQQQDVPTSDEIPDDHVKPAYPVENANRDHGAIADESPRASDPQSASPLSEDVEEDSVAMIEFERSRTSLDSSLSGRHGHASLHDSMQDSVLLLPPELLHETAPPSDATAAEARKGDARSAALPRPSTTILAAAVSQYAPQAIRLMDYFDSDRYCEPIPCWAFADQGACALHPGILRRPMLLFCLQVLDEYIAMCAILAGDPHVAEMCKLARLVFASFWEEDVLNRPMRGGDIVLSDYLERRTSLPGVGWQVWSIIGQYWVRHKHNFLHSQGVFFDDSSSADRPQAAQTWQRIRNALQVFGLGPHQAVTLVAETRDVGIDGRALQLTEAHLERIQCRLPSTAPIEFGLAHLERLRQRRQGIQEADNASRLSPLWRDVIGQVDWKLAFRAVEIHLRKWSRDLQVFPCGAFSRGAAFGSVLDILVAVGGHDPPSGQAHPASVDVIVDVLVTAGIVESLKAVRRLGDHRALATVAFKSSLLILDLKVYERPRSWFALLYYTGPEPFVRKFFTTLVGHGLDELEWITFDTVFEATIRAQGLRAVSAVDSEKDVFDILNREYLPPTQRF